MPRVDSWGFAGFCCTVFSSTFLSATGTAGDVGCRRGQLFPAGLVRLLSRPCSHRRETCDRPPTPSPHACTPTAAAHCWGLGSQNWSFVPELVIRLTGRCARDHCAFILAFLRRPDAPVTAPTASSSARTSTTLDFLLLLPPPPPGPCQ